MSRLFHEVGGASPLGLYVFSLVQSHSVHLSWRHSLHAPYTDGTVLQSLTDQHTTNISLHSSTTKLPWPPRPCCVTTSAMAVISVLQRLSINFQYNTTLAVVTAHGVETAALAPKCHVLNVSLAIGNAYWLVN